MTNDKTIPILVVITVGFISGTLTSDSFAEIIENELCKGVSVDNPIFVTTNLENYEREDFLLAEGCVDNIAHFKGINVMIHDPDGNVITGGAVVPNVDGTFSREFILDKHNFPVNGTYSVVADANGEYYASKTFVVPEFGIMASAMLSVSLLLILVLQKNYTKIY